MMLAGSIIYKESGIGLDDTMCLLEKACIITPHRFAHATPSAAIGWTTHAQTSRCRNHLYESGVEASSKSLSHSCDAAERGLYMRRCPAPRSPSRFAPGFLLVHTGCE